MVTDHQVLLRGGREIGHSSDASARVNGSRTCTSRTHLGTDREASVRRALLTRRVVAGSNIVAPLKEAPEYVPR